MSEIKYSTQDGVLGFLSDITPSTVVMRIKNAKGETEARVFTNAIAAYAYLCTDDEDRKGKLLNALNVKQLNYLASARSGFTEPDSAKLRIKHKRRVLRAKFITGHPYFTKILLDTGDADLVEHRYWERTDSFWGKAKDGTGRNEHGKLLMEIRDELRESLSSNVEDKPKKKKVKSSKKVKDSKKVREGDAPKKKKKKSSK